MVLYFSTEFCFNMQKIGKFGGREGAGGRGAWEGEMEMVKDKGKEREGERFYIFKEAGWIKE